MSFSVFGDGPRAHAAHAMSELYLKLPLFSAARLTASSATSGYRSRVPRSALGRIRSSVIVCEFLVLATCYAELNGRVRAKSRHRGLFQAELRRSRAAQVLYVCTVDAVKLTSLLY
jgi:hypothetical protein